MPVWPWSRCGMRAVSSIVCCLSKRFIRSQFLKYWCKVCPIIIFRLVLSPMSLSPSTSSHIGAVAVCISTEMNASHNTKKKHVANVSLCPRLISSLALLHFGWIIFVYFVVVVVPCLRSALFYRNCGGHVLAMGSTLYDRHRNRSSSLAFRRR